MMRPAFSVIGMLLGAVLLATPLRAQTVLVQPYIQTGDGSTLEGADSKAILWLTDQTPGEFRVAYSALAL
ncbi:MAG: hypothetical protein ABI318_11375 [Chthoniobacteraceae bacterium]